MPEDPGPPADVGGVEGPTPREFEQIRRLAHEQFGLDLRHGKEALVAARLGKQMRARRIGSFRDYFRYLMEDRTGEALIGLIDALTTNHTGFLREPAHFEFLRHMVLPRLASRGAIEIWSAACATGEEAYSLAFTILDCLGDADAGRVRILATDISMRALESARQAIYPAERLAGLPAGWQRRFLLRGEGRWQGFCRVKPFVQEMVRFARLNLIEPILESRAFPAIFCRNVMIYFDRATQEGVVSRLAEKLEPGGYLFIGHAESLTGIRHALRYVQPAVYRRPETGPAAGRKKGTGWA